MILKVLRRSLVLLVLLLSLTACTSFKKGKLTVTHVHDNIYFNQTTVTELAELYGEPDIIETNVENVLIAFDEDDETESSISEKLADYTDYWETVLGIQAPDYPYTNEFDAYYEYRGKNLGLSYVRFYIKNNQIRDCFFGEITNPLVARQDKYLRQVLEEGTSKN